MDYRAALFAIWQAAPEERHVAIPFPTAVHSGNVLIQCTTAGFADEHCRASYTSLFPRSTYLQCIDDMRVETRRVRRAHPYKPTWKPSRSSDQHMQEIQPGTKTSTRRHPRSWELPVTNWSSMQHPDPFAVRWACGAAIVHSNLSVRVYSDKALHLSYRSLVRFGSVINPL